jgi:hypothetical protein
MAVRERDFSLLPGSAAFEVAACEADAHAWIFPEICVGRPHNPWSRSCADRHTLCGIL